MLWSCFTNPGSYRRAQNPNGDDVLAWRNGYLAVKSKTCIDPYELRDPLWRTFWYPIANMSKAEAESYAIGAELVYEGDGLYRYKDSSLGRVRFRLLMGGRTVATETFVEPIPKPPDAIVRTRKKKLPLGMAPFERITHFWESRLCRWEPRRELLRDREAEDLGLEW